MPAARAKILVSIGLLLAVGMVFGQTVGHEFHEGDDKEFVYGNQHVRAGLTADGANWAFTAGPYGEWYPLAMLSHMLDCQLFGLKAGGHYLTSLLLHAASSVLLFLVLLQMTGEFWPSGFVAALFAVHPQHVESVAWVAERKDILSGLFFMLTLAAWLGYVRNGRPLGRYLLVVALFALGLLSKPMLVTLPPLLLLLSFWPLGRWGVAAGTPAGAMGQSQGRLAERGSPTTLRGLRKVATVAGDLSRDLALLRRPEAIRLMVEQLPLLALAAADCLMTLRTHNQGNVTLSWVVRAGNAPIAGVTYLGQMLFPVGLTMLHPASADGPSKVAVAGATAILAAISLAAVVWRRRCPYLFVGWFWFLGMLFPVLGLVNLGGAYTMADRYMYLPGIGLYIVLAWGGARLAQRWPAQKWLLGTCGATAIAVLTAVGAWQTSVWRDDVTMWRHALACSPGNVEAESGLAGALWKKGRLDEAIPLFQRAIQHTQDSVPFTNFGMMLAQLGRLDEATSLLRQAVAIRPGSYNAQVDLGLVLSQRRELAEAEQHLRRALELNPRGASAHYGLARLLLFSGKPDQACDEFDRAVALNPGDPAIRNDLASVLLKRGKVDEAVAQLDAALKIDADSPLAHVNLARALALQGRHEAALEHCRRALAIDPHHAVARGELDKLERAQANRNAR